MQRISTEKMSAVLQKALAKGIFEEADSSIIFHDLTFLKNRVEHLESIFPKGTLHTVATKANPLPAILSFLQKLGVGAEAATLPEVYLAQKSGYSNSHIVFDSPAKTEAELLYALEAGIHINVDSFSELRRLADLYKQVDSQSNIGLRINPNVGSGTIKATSVGSKLSKFGLLLDSYREEIKKAYLDYPWLNGIHVHIGSQGCSLEQLVNAAKKIYTLAKEVNTLLAANNAQNRIIYLDMGGGLPVAYKTESEAIRAEAYLKALRENVPGMFSDGFKLITEFGRYIHANGGWVASRTEYVKHYREQNIAVIHVGADLLMRRCYMPQDWYHDISVLDSKGQMKRENEYKNYTIAGPLCFNGDIIHKNVKLPLIRENDFIVVHDTGAYTLSMWSRHTSRQIPKVVGYLNDGEEFRILKKRETVEEVLRFWS